MVIDVRSATFLGGAPLLHQLPKTSLPEIAVIGRSNVGKSTFVNRLAGQRKLARTSSTPGRTREINLFELQLAKHSNKPKRIILADLPGFGYAKVSRQQREDLAKLVVDYVQGREKLVMVLLLNDCRRAPAEDELAVQKLAFEHNRRLSVVLTKIDKLGRNAQLSACRDIASAYGLEAQDLLTSGVKTDTKEIWNRVLPLLESAS